MFYIHISLHPKWEFSHIGLSVKNLFELRLHYSDLIRQEYNFGSWSTQCHRVLQSKHAPLCQHLLKKGQTPTPYRGSLWSFVLLGNPIGPYVCTCTTMIPYQEQYETNEISEIFED